MATEKWLIDANEILKRNDDAFKEARAKPNEHFVSVIQHLTVREMVNSSPTVDAVEVVRCGVCRHRHTRPNCAGRPMDFFCADGERNGG